MKDYLTPSERRKLSIVKEKFSDFGRNVEPRRNYDVAICVGVVIIIALLGYFALTQYWLPERMIDRIFPVAR